MLREDSRVVNRLLGLFVGGPVVSLRLFLRDTLWSLLLLFLGRLVLLMHGRQTIVAPRERA
jgi:hypothetical protein